MREGRAQGSRGERKGEGRRETPGPAGGGGGEADGRARPEARGPQSPREGQEAA